MHRGCRLWEYVDKFQATDSPRSFHPRVLLKFVHLHKEVMVAVVEVWVEHLLVDGGVGPRQLLVLVRGERQVVVARVEDVVQGHRLPAPIHRDPLVLGGHHVSQALFSGKENLTKRTIHGAKFTKENAQSQSHSWQGSGGMVLLAPRRDWTINTSHFTDGLVAQVY